MKKQISRRDFLKAASLGSLGLSMAVAGCQPQVIEKEVEKKVVETVVVEKEVEKTVKETVVVEKEVEKIVEKVGEAVNINFFHAWHQAIAGPVIDPMIKEYMEANPGVIITQTAADPDTLGPMILAAVAAGTPPDIGWGYSSAWVQAGALVPLDDYLTQYGYEKDQVYPYLWEMFTVDGKIYGMPVENSTVAWWYLNNIMQEVGLSAPTPDWDWNDLVEYGKKLTKKTGDKVERWGLNMPMLEWWYFITLLMEQGGSFLSSDLSKPAFNSEAGLRAMKFAASLVQEGITPPPGYALDVNAAFPSGLIGLSWDGPWRFGNYVNELGLDTGVVGHPYCPDTGSNTTYVFGGALGVFKTTPERQDASMKFLTWFLSKEMNAKWGVLTGYLPIRKDAAETQEYKDFVAGKGKVMSGFMEVFKVGQVIPGMNELPKFFDAVTLFNEECWQPVLLGKRTPEEGLATAEKLILEDPTLLSRE